MRLLTAIMLSLSFLSVGCSFYTFNPRGKSTISSIAVERFENKTAEFGLEDIMTDRIIDAIIADGNLKVVEKEYAEAVLVGSLINYERKPYNTAVDDVVETYSVRMYFNVTLLNPATGDPFWNAKINQVGVYNLAEESESDGQIKAIELLVEDILNRTTKSW